MIKTRIVPVLLWDETGLVKPVAFKRPARKVGSLMQAVKVYERRGVDELILLDISDGERPRFDEIKEFTSQLFCPLTVGGGVRSLPHIEQLLKAGADKVAICTHASYSFMRYASRQFGAQAIVAAIDILGGHVHTRNGIHDTKINAVEWAVTMAEAGAGEILLTCIDRDGTNSGYNLNVIQAVARSVMVPVIANGGCCSPADMDAALRCGAHAVAASSMFLFTDTTPSHCKEFLSKCGHDMRLTA